jgi:hypothetical protein
MLMARLAVISDIHSSLAGERNIAPIAIIGSGFAGLSKTKVWWQQVSPGRGILLRSRAAMTKHLISWNSPAY